MSKFLVVYFVFLLWIVGCAPTQPKLELVDGEIVEAPKGSIVFATIKMPDGSIERVEAKRWRLWKTSIAIMTEDKEFLTGMNNVVMICEHTKKEVSK